MIVTSFRVTLLSPSPSLMDKDAPGFPSVRGDGEALRVDVDVALLASVRHIDTIGALARHCEGGVPNVDVDVARTHMKGKEAFVFCAACRDGAALNVKVDVACADMLRMNAPAVKPLRHDRDVHQGDIAVAFASLDGQRRPWIPFRSQRW